MMAVQQEIKQEPMEEQVRMIEEEDLAGGIEREETALSTRRDRRSRDGIGQARTCPRMRQGT
jgi:hypothetical protein